MRIRLTNEIVLYLVSSYFQTSALTADQFFQLIEPEAAVQEVESPNIPAGPTLSVFKWLRREYCLRNDFCKRFDSLVSRKELTVSDCLKAGSSVLQWGSINILQGGLSFIISYYYPIDVPRNGQKTLKMVSVFRFWFSLDRNPKPSLLQLSIDSFASELSQFFILIIFSYYECILCSKRWSTAALAFRVRKKKI